MLTRVKQHEKINYIELPARNIEATKAFFRQVFGWVFTDYGPDYSAFSDQGVDGGFYRSEQVSLSSQGGTLVVFYSESLEQTLEKIQSAGGVIIKPIFEFPGGRRFHFTEPSGNEFAVWSDIAAVE